MSEEYEIIHIVDEGRAIKNKKTGKIYYSEFQIIEEKNKELDQYKNKVEYYENFEINKTVDKIRLRHNKEIKELYQKIDQYKNNWEELKKWIKEKEQHYLNDECPKEIKYEFLRISNEYTKILDKMKELEGE